MKDFQYNDGGRSQYFKGKDVGDCVTRAIANASGLDYLEVYNKLAEGMKNQRKTKRSGSTTGKKSAINGVNVSRKWFKDYMKEIGFQWVPTMLIGQGCKVHLHREELPSGNLVIQVSKHFTCMIDGVINDTYNPQRGSVIGTKDGVSFKQKESRCVYGYYQKVN